MIKKSPLFIILLFTSLICFGQSPRQLTEADSLEVEMEVLINAEKLENSLKEDEQASDYLATLSLEFSVDTFKIEERLRLQMDIDYSTNGMISATLEAKREYDKLLNKYYKRILSKLEDNDKTILLETQRNWISFRDSELELNELLMDDKYSGGGTIQSVIVASRVLDLTQNRVIELYRYLGRNYK